jgi:flagellar hook-associated protein 1 FlgK
MNLTTALLTARSSLAATSVQTSVTSRNVAGSGDPGYSRKIASVSSNSGYVTVNITRASDQALFESMLKSTSTLAGQQALSAGLDQLESSANNLDESRSPSAMISALSDALTSLQASPADSSLQQAVVTAANDVVSSLNDTSDTVQSVRAQADAEMAASVDTINSILSKFKAANDEIVKGYQSGADITDALDTRDSLLSQLSEEIGITTITRSDGSMAVYTDSGATLFETTARTVSFTPTATYTAGMTGNAVYVDGVPITGSSATMAIGSGKLYGLATLRDDATVQYQNQLDEIARGLINSFAETDQVGSGSPLAGLFTNAGSSTIPGSLVQGLASAITVNANVDPTQGGTLSLIRDGGISGNSNYVYNNPGGTPYSAYSDRIEQLVSGLTSTQSFSSAAGLSTSASLNDFSSSSIAWLEAQRQATSNNVTYQTTILSNASTALSNATGVSIDDEMAKMLELEKAYAASSKLISAIDGMLNDLLNAIGTS